MSRIQRTAVNLILDYISTDPMEKLPKMLDLAEKLDRGKHYTKEIRVMRDALTDEENIWHTFTKNLIAEVDTRIIKKFVECFLINSNLKRVEVARSIEAKYDCNVPWAILMDPTSACNLHCTGCWAAQYGGKLNLSYETLDSICRQGKELGVRFYIFSGGEPLVRKHDVIKLLSLIHI